MKNKFIFLMTGIFFIISCSKTKTTKSFSCGDNITDIDGNVYTTVSIGTQCWMKENLKTTHFRDGSAIGEVEDSVLWSDIFTNNTQSSAWCYYNMDAGKNATYGKLYNWYAVNNSKKLSPD